MTKIEPEKRNCYCTLWQTHPNFLKDCNIPYGYCGICDCGELGHLRHAPDGAYTADFCDSCYRKLEIFNLIRAGLALIFFTSFFVSLFAKNWLVTIIIVDLLIMTFIWRMVWFNNYQAKLKSQKTAI